MRQRHKVLITRNYEELPFKYAFKSAVRCASGRFLKRLKYYKTMTSRGCKTKQSAPAPEHHSSCKIERSLLRTAPKPFAGAPHARDRVPNPGTRPPSPCGQREALRRTIRHTVHTDRKWYDWSTRLIEGLPAKQLFYVSTLRQMSAATGVCMCAYVRVYVYMAHKTEFEKVENLVGG